MSLQAAVDALATILATAPGDVPKDSSGAPIKVGDVVRPDYSRPGWRLKNLKRGHVVAIEKGQPVVEWSSHRAPTPGRMLIVETRKVQGAAAHEAYPDGRWIPRLGDEVYRSVRGFAGSGGSIHGVVVKGRGGLRVKVTGFNGAMPSTDVQPGKTLPLDATWTVTADPHHERKATQQRSAGEQKEQVQRLAAEAVERYAHKHGFLLVERAQDVDAGEKLYQLTSAGRWGTGDPEAVTASEMGVATNHDVRYGVVYIDADGGERTTGPKPVGVYRKR